MSFLNISISPLRKRIARFILRLHLILTWSDKYRNGRGIMLCLGEDILSQFLTEVHSNNKIETVFQRLIQKNVRLRDSKIESFISLNINL